MTFIFLKNLNEKDLNYNSCIFKMCMIKKSEQKPLQKYTSSINNINIKIPVVVKEIFHYKN